MSNIIININELSVELAHSRMLHELNIQDENDVVEVDDNILVYTKEAQTSFNKWYDYYINKLDTMK